MPRQGQIEEWFRRFETRTGYGMSLSPRSLAMRLKGLSFAEIEDFGMDVLRRIVLDEPEADVKKITTARLRHWRNRFNVAQANGNEDLE